MPESMSPEQVEQTWRRALLHRQNGDHDGAIELLLNLVEASPSAEVYTTLAGECRALGRTGQAYAAYKLALQRDPENIDAIFGVGSLHTEQGRDDDAANVYGFALKCRPDLPEAYVNLGSAFARLGQYDEAELCFLNAFRRVSDGPIAHQILYNIARVCAATDRPDGAIDGLICAGAADAHYAQRAFLDDIFDDVRDHPRFERVVILGERLLHTQLKRMLKDGGREPVQRYFRTYPYVQRVVATRTAFVSFRGLLPDPPPT